MEGFCVTGFGGLIFGGACTWRGLYSEFYGICSSEDDLRLRYYGTNS